MGRAFEVRKKAMAATAAAKTKIYSKFGKEIYIAAKSGIPDPSLNVSLARIIERAKKAQVTADIIKRAIDKASSGVSEDYTSVTYEGFGPGASTFIVECLTDNVNRTISEVRNCFTKSKSKLGVSGCVSHGYTHSSILSFNNMSEEVALEALIMADVDINSIETDEDIVTVYADPGKLYEVKNTLEAACKSIIFEEEEIAYIPQETISLQGEELELYERLTQMLNEVDDVQNVYHNVKD